MKLIAIDNDQIPAIYRSMEENFTREEVRDFDEVIRLCKGGKYVIYHIEEDGIYKGFVGIWHLRDFVFLEYLVIYEAYRNGGTGGRVVELIKRNYGNVILEAELPEQPIQVRRLNFYKRHGMCVNFQPYRQPPFREGESGCPLYLLSYPSPLTDFEGTVEYIYREVYERVYK